MLDLGSDVVTLVAIGSAALSIVLLGLVLLMGLRLRKLRNDHRRAFGSGSEDAVVTLGRHADELVAIRGELEEARAAAAQLRELQRGTLSRLGIVRYDAFADMGGMLSFSAAMLDERGDGIVISAINGRTETRCYSKPISGGASDQNLSNEEAAAIEAAIEGRPPSAFPPEGRRRRRAAS